MIGFQMSGTYHYVLHDDLRSNEYDDRSARYHQVFRWLFSCQTKMRIQRHCNVNNKYVNKYPQN